MAQDRVSKIKEKKGKGTRDETNEASMLNKIQFSVKYKESIAEFIPSA